MAVDLNPFDPLPTSPASVYAVVPVSFVPSAVHDALLPHNVVSTGSASVAAAQSHTNSALDAADLALVSAVTISSAAAVGAQHSLIRVILPLALYVASPRVVALLSAAASVETMTAGSSWHPLAATTSPCGITASVAAAVALMTSSVSAESPLTKRHVGVAHVAVAATPAASTAAC